MHLLATSILLLFLSAPVQAEPRDDARRHFLTGLQAAGEGRYEAALAEFESAQRIYPHPATLYNIARAHTDLGNLEEAIATYTLYQAASPENAEEVETALRRLRTQRAAQQAAPAPQAPLHANQTPTLERLNEIAAELQEITSALKGTERTTPKSEEAPEDAEQAVSTEPEEPHDPQDQIADSPPSTDEFREEAYEREVISAVRYGQDPVDSPSSVTIVTREDIRMSGATNLPDLFRQVVGVEVMSLSASNPEVSIRGFNRELSNKVLVLIDGRSVYEDLLGTTFWGMLPISMHEIERIEIIRGPAGASYGANAVTGVINILTQTPGTGENLVSLNAGAPGYDSSTAMASGSAGQFTYRLSTGHQRTGRWSRTVEVSEDDHLIQAGEEQALNVVRANGQIDRRLGSTGNLSLSSGYADGITELYVLGALGDYAMDFQAGYGRLDVTGGPIHFRLFTNQYLSEASPWVESEGARSLRTSIESRMLDGELEASKQFATGQIQHQLLGGVGYRLKGISFGHLNPADELIWEHHMNAFLQEEAEMEPVRMVGSIRLDRHPLVPMSETISPRGATVVHLAEQTSLRASVGSSFRAPSYMESYTDLTLGTDVDAVYVNIVGDENLLPERVFTTEIGIHDESSPWHRADVAVFYNKVTDLIFVGDLTSALNAYDPEKNGFLAGETPFVNLDPTWHGLGLEVDAHAFPLDGLDIWANINLESITEEDGSEQVRDLSTSTWKVNAGLAYRSPWRMDFSGRVHHLSPQTWRLRDYDAEGNLVVEEQDIAARTIYAARLAAWPLPDRSLEFALTAWNIHSLLTGTTMREHPKGQRVGGRAFGTATLRF